MCDLNCVNLIDLNLDGDNPLCNKQINLEVCSQSLKDNLHLVPPTLHRCESIENNPFDRIQKLVDRVDDPFDMVEKEASLKALDDFKSPSEVKLGNLLSLSDDNLVDAEQKSEFSTINLKELFLESPPLSFRDKQSSDSVSGTDTESNPSSSTETSVSAKLKKNSEYRRRLLKLSISNAAYNSPAARKESMEVEDIFGTPVSSMLSRAAEFGENLLSSESPLKLVEDEELLSESSSNFIDSEKNFEADLELLKIPMLNKLTSPVVEQISLNSSEKLVEVENKTFDNLENTLPNINTIKLKLKAKNVEINNHHQQEIASLIQNLRTLIASGEMIDNFKKQEINDLLESLSSALKPINKEDTLYKNSKMLDVAQQSIKRQGTFDMDLQEKHEMNTHDQPLVEEMPKSMVSSSATYDAETCDENHDLNIPEIEPLSSQTLPPQCLNQHNKYLENSLQNDVNDIMEQLGGLFINNSGDNCSSKKNPTFIVIMDPNKFNHTNLNSSNQNEKQRSALLTHIETSINVGSPDFTNSNYMPRRRSQSLSIHDEISKQMPLQRSREKQQSVKMNVSPPINKTPPNGSKEVAEFKTPVRLMRRNSYSSGTPFTTQIGIRRTGFGIESKNQTQLRRTQTLDTHHEGQQQANIRSMTMPFKKLSTFKPDLKKKPKHSTESIIKSSAPLKATIPVKKVAPILKTSPPTPENNAKANIIHNKSLQSQSKGSKLPTTPLQSKRMSTLGLDVGYPNAFSTPAAFASPLKRPTTPINKPRYSYISLTPNPKSSVNNSATSASFKRRTITEFKSKSPLRPRTNSSASLPVAASSRASTIISQLSTSVGGRISKTPVKATTANTATVKPSNRLRSRASFGGSVLSVRNKENKRP